MGGGPAHKVNIGGPFIVPRVKGWWQARLGFAAVWFFIFYRIKEDGGHHFLFHHPWEEPKMIAYLEEVDKKYGTRYAIDNMHHH